MFVIRHTGFKTGRFLNRYVGAQRRECQPSMWSDDISEAVSFELKDEVDDYVKYLREIVGYPVEAILTFGVEK